MPNMTVMAPKNGWELDQMLRFAWRQETPVAVRYPRGDAWQGLDSYRQSVEMGRGEWICTGEEIALLAVGSMVETAMEVRELLKAKGKKISVINARFVKPLDEQLLEEISKKHSLVVTMEEGVLSGGFGEAVSAWYMQRETKVINIALPDKFIEHGSVGELKKKYGLEKDSIVEAICASSEWKKMA
jgi:1-deoxy-D-xylulose-5-phosphate synthase